MWVQIYRERVPVYHTLKRLISPSPRQYNTERFRKHFQKLSSTPKVNHNFNGVGVQDPAIRLMITQNSLLWGRLLCRAQLAEM